jgi:hypothetical protein
MHTGVLLLAAFVLGVLVAGPISAALVTVLPPDLRLAPVVWASAGLVVAATMAACWALFLRRR